jgi:hypothetical protein
MSASNEQIKTVFRDNDVERKQLWAELSEKLKAVITRYRKQFSAEVLLEQSERLEAARLATTLRSSDHDERLHLGHDLLDYVDKITAAAEAEGRTKM